VTERRGRRRKQLQNNLNEKRRCWNLKEEATDHTVCRNGFGRGCGPVVKQNAECVDERTAKNFIFVVPCIVNLG